MKVINYKNRITNNNITELKENEIFVFGSNESGRHGKGAAKTAMKWGAKYGQAKGLQGKTYGIPTVNSSISNKLSLNRIDFYLQLFYQDCVKYPNLTFLVTEIGCGLAGWSVKDIAPLFDEFAELENVHLPKSFWNVIKHNKEYIFE
jgi:hypothetical protein